MEGQLIKTVGTTPIYVDGNGRFQARIGDRTVTRKTLAELEKEIARHSGGLKVLWLHHVGALVVTTIIGIVTRGHSARFRLEDGSLEYTYSGAFYLYDAETEATLREIEQKVKEENAHHKRVLDGYNAEWSAITQNLTVVRESNFNDLLAESQQATES